MCSLPALTLDEIFPYFDQEPNLDDIELETHVRSQKRERCEHTINRINRWLPLISEQWSTATPIEIYVAFLQCCGDPEEMLLSIHNAAFMAQVRLEVNRLRQSRHALPDTPDPSPDVPDVPFEARPFRPKKTDVVRSKNYLPRPKEVPSEIWFQWSEVHQQSYLKGLEHPNAYFYRNCAPGERQKTGSWSSEEKQLFLKRLKEMKQLYPDGQQMWGIFSQAIPGRVGYQCSSFYQTLLDAGEIRKEQRLCTPRKQAVKREDKPARSPVFAGVSKIAPLSMYERKAQKNPLKGAIDFVTKAEMEVPAISPDGYVLDYKTWLNIIAEKSEDPFTRNHINKRQLTILTFKNIDQFRDKIKNL
jgi:hypothetical protein